jgi:hypothetical protein
MIRFTLMARLSGLGLGTAEALLFEPTQQRAIPVSLSYTLFTRNRLVEADRLRLHRAWQDLDLREELSGRRLHYAILAAAFATDELRRVFPDARRVYRNKKWQVWAVERHWAESSRVPNCPVGAGRALPLVTGGMEGVAGTDDCSL